MTEEFVRRVTRLPGSVLSPVLWTTLQVASYRGKFDVKMVEPLALAAQIKCPVFLVHGTADDLISTAHSENIHDALSGKKDLWIVEGAGHARIKRHSKQEYSERIVDFFKESLNPESCMPAAEPVSVDG